MKFKLNLLVAAAIAVTVIGCGKDDEGPEIGTVKGTVSPANGAGKVFLTSGTDTISRGTVTAGAFEMTGVKSGTYSISVKPNIGYNAPAPANVTVTTNQTTQVPVISLSAIPATGYMALTMGGTVYTHAGPLAFDNSTKTYYFTNSNGFDFYVQLPVITKAGTYTTATANSSLEFTVINHTNTNMSWTANNATGSGTFTVTDLNTATKRGNATFSFTAQPNTGATGTKVVTNGVLKNVILMN